MRKIAATLILALASVFMVSGVAQADETRVSQYGPSDKQTEKGVWSDRDIREMEFLITDEGRYQFFFEMRKHPKASKISSKSYLEIRFDTTNNGKANYTFRFSKFTDETVAHSAEMLDSKGRPVANCDLYQWVIEGNFAISFERDCIISGGSRFQVQAVSTSDGKKFDYYPDNKKWVRLKSNYLSVAACNSREKDEEVTYKGQRYVCVKSGSKWKWQDYGKVKGSKSKWLTERAYYLCELDKRYGLATLSDGGKTLEITTDRYFVLITFEDLDCVYKTLKMPKSVQSKIGVTSGLSGIVEASWGDLAAFWTYYSTRGLDITIYYDN